MLDPRIYRSGLIPVALAVIVLAFSLGDQQGPASTTLAPDAFNGQNVYSTMTSLAQRYPNRLPGSAADYDMAVTVAQALRRDGFGVQTQLSRARTAVGTRTVETVTGTRAGLSSGSIVVVAHRDALQAPAVADLSGTAVLLELARVLSGQTQNRSIVLASTSASTGEAGAIDLARSLGKSVDAVLVLGDLAGAQVRSPLVVPWSNGPGLAPTMLRNTVAAALRSQAQLKPGAVNLVSQFARLAFPFTTSGQGAFNAAGQPAVLLSLAGERGPGPDEPLGDVARITGMGRTVLQTVNALDSSGSIPAPSGYLIYDGKTVPAWAVRVLVLALILPVLAATIDGAARARRRGYRIMSRLGWVLTAAIPFGLVVGVTVAARAIGLLDVAPPGPVPGGAVSLSTAGWAVLAAAVALIIGGLVARRVLVLRRRSRGARRDPGTGAAILLLLCVVTIFIWLGNPFAAALAVPALNLWMWLLDPERGMPRPLAFILLGLGLAPPVLIVLHYAGALGLGPVGLAWNGVLLVAGGHVGALAALEWSVLLGCTVSVIPFALRARRRPRAMPKEVPVTVRGPITYAGPGSLGGTESALRR